MVFAGRAVIPGPIQLGHLEQVYVRPYAHSAGIGNWPGASPRERVVSALNHALQDTYAVSDHLVDKKIQLVVPIAQLDAATPKTDVLAIVPDGSNNQETHILTVVSGKRAYEVNPCQDALAVFAAESEHQRRRTNTFWQWAANPPGLDSRLLAEGFLDCIPGADLRMPNSRK